MMTTLQSTTKLPYPSAEEVAEYRTFLNQQNVVIDDETEFLDATSDLVSLGYSFLESTYPKEQRNSTRSRRPSSEASGPRPNRRPPVRKRSDYRMLQVKLLASLVAAVVLPVLTFTEVQALLVRMVIVLVTGALATGAGVWMGLDGPLLKTGGLSDVALVVGGYGAVMAMLALVIR